MIMKRKPEERRPFDAWDMAGQTTPWVKWLAIAVLLLLHVIFLFGAPPAP